MCSVSISEQEASQIDTVIGTVVSVAVVSTVRTSVIPMINIADDHDYSYRVGT